VTERRGGYVSDREGMGTWNYSYRENDFLETWWHKVKKILWSYLNGSGVKSLFAVPCHQFRDFQRWGRREQGETDILFEKEWNWRLWRRVFVYSSMGCT